MTNRLRKVFQKAQKLDLLAEETMVLKFWPIILFSSALTLIALLRLTIFQVSEKIFNTGLRMERIEKFVESETRDWIKRELQNLLQEVRNLEKCVNPDS